MSKTSNRSLFDSYASFASFDSKVQSSIVATCKAALSIFGDDTVARITSADSITFSNFRKQPSVLYIQTRIAEQSFYSPLVSVLFEQLFGWVMEKLSEKKDLPVLMLIDEAAFFKAQRFKSLWPMCVSTTAILRVLSRTLISWTAFTESRPHMPYEPTVYPRCISPTRE